MIRPASRVQTRSNELSALTARPIGIDTYQEPVIYMRSDCDVCRSEGFESQSRVLVSTDKNSFIATLNVVRGDFLDHGEAGLSDIAWSLVDCAQPCPINISHPEPLESFGHIRAKLFGNELSDDQLENIVSDITSRRYSDVQLSAFLSACVGDRMTPGETVALTRSMVDAGERLSWPQADVYDKHCVGGLPGNRTTPIVVAIVTACGVVMPKTSSRAITSPAGTADTMETITRVDLSLEEMRDVVEREGGCLVWGGSVSLSPADDVLIRVERALDLDSETQLVASVLSKKIAAGSNHTLIDIPVGNTAKVRNAAAAERLATLMRHVGTELDLGVETVLTDGTQPIGRGIGPALEARDVLLVLQGDLEAPVDLKERSVLLAGRILELSGRADEGAGSATALAVLEDGRAWRKFQTICHAQGGFSSPPDSSHSHDVEAAVSGQVTAIDNRRLAKVAKLAGAPTASAAGVDLHVRLGDIVESGLPVMTIHAEAPGELAYAVDYLANHPDLLGIENADQELSA